MSLYRVSVGVMEIAGIASGLVAGLRSLGCHADLVLGYRHPFSYAIVQEPSLLNRLWSTLGAARATNSSRSLLRKIFFVLLHRLVGWVVFFKCLLNYDIFVFIYGQTFTGTILELRLLKLAQKKIVFVYVGSDARPPYIDGGVMPHESNTFALDYIVSLGSKTLKMIKIQERYASYIVNSPASAQFQSGRFINWFSLGVPLNVQRSNALVAQVVQDRAIRILHSPSSLDAKGTLIIEKIVDGLRAKGHRIDFIKLTGVSNSVVHEKIMCCDFVVDQVYSDSPMAVFAAEAACFGKAAVVAGYFANFVSEFIHQEDVPPSLFVLPEELSDAIERMMVDVCFREDLARRANKFVNERWAPEEVARRYLRLFNDDVPESWYCSASSLSYMGGWGASEIRIQNLISLISKRHGFSVFGLDDKPLLKSQLLQLSNQKSEVKDA
nr:hypothetical protein [uncultured Pseudomonas sp.]